MLKVKLLSYGVNTERSTRDGTLSILIKPNQNQPRDTMRNSDSTLADHSTLFQDFQCTEFSDVTELTMLLSTDTRRDILINNSSSTKELRPLDPTTGRTMLWKSKEMEETRTSDSPVPSTQDGGNSGDTRMQ